MVLGVVGGAVVVSTVAALFPPHRAARIDPITALRHE
jgi:ABC-type lipoprotein release transport system permease subunit